MYYWHAQCTACVNVPLCVAKTKTTALLMLLSCDKPTYYTLVGIGCCAVPHFRIHFVSASLQNCIHVSSLSSQTFCSPGCASQVKSNSFQLWCFIRATLCLAAHPHSTLWSNSEEHHLADTYVCINVVHFNV